MEDLPLYLRQYGNKREAGGSTLPRLLGQVERDALVEALAASGGNKVKAAGGGNDVRGLNGDISSHTDRDPHAGLH